MEKEELFPHAEACQTRGQQIDFIVLDTSSDSDTLPILSTSTKHQVRN